MNKLKNKKGLGIFSIKLVVASAVTFMFASFMHTHSVLSGLISIGAEIPLSLRIQTIFIDFIGLLPIYGTVVFIIMLIAMPIANSIVTKINSKGNTKPPRNHLLIYASAGAFAMFCILFSIYLILNMTMIAGARGWFGLFSQTIAGAIGGIVFGLLRPIQATT